MSSERTLPSARVHAQRDSADESGTPPVIDAEFARGLADRAGRLLLGVRDEMGYADGKALKTAGDKAAHDLLRRTSIHAHRGSDRGVGLLVPRPQEHPVTLSRGDDSDRELLDQLRYFLRDHQRVPHIDSGQRRTVLTHPGDSLPKETRRRG